jgi:hypothetical protein
LTDPTSVAVAVAAAAVASLAAWFSLPRPPDLDGERWFKVILATLLRGRTDAHGGSADDWERQVLAFVPYHPAGRKPEDKVAHPATIQLSSGPLPGEPALLEALASLTDQPARWRRMYDEDRPGIEARLAAPEELGPAYDPRAVLGADWGWDTLAAWGGDDTAFIDRLLGRLGRWLLVEGPDRAAAPALASHLKAVLGERATLVAWSEAPLAEATDALRELAAEQVKEPRDRLIVLGEGAGMHRLLRVLQEEPGLRDRVMGVVSVGGLLAGIAGTEGPCGEAAIRDWMGAHFNHVALDTERIKHTPYLAMQWLDRQAKPAGVSGHPLEAARFPDPSADGFEMILPVDLGPLPTTSDVPLDLYARGLVAVVGLMVLATQPS